jgi:hypothetical protein
MTENNQDIVPVIQNNVPLMQDNDMMDIIEEEVNKIETPTIDENKLFSQIVNFVESVQENYGQEFYELKLYNLLLENTGLIHIDQRKKHVDIFREFLDVNKMCILTQDLSIMKQDRIIYSDKIFLNIKAVFELANEEDKDVIWEHLLVLLAMTSPDKKAQNVLALKTPKQTVKEDNNFQNIFENLTEQMKNTDLNQTDPMQFVGNIMNSGIMNDIFNSMPKMDGDGESIDFNAMMQSFQQVMTNLQQQSAQK